MLTRNNEIQRRIQKGDAYADLLPAAIAPLSDELVAFRAEAAPKIGLLKPARLRPARRP